MENTSLKSIIEGLNADQTELNKFIKESTRPNVKRSLTDQLAMIKQRCDEEQKKIEISKEQNNSNTDSTKTFDSINKYSFDAGNKFVKIYLMDGFAGIKDVLTEEMIKTEFKENSVEVFINNFKGRNYKFACYNLNNDIVPEKSTCKANSTGLVISLKKVNDSDSWSSLDKKAPSEEGQGGMPGGMGGMPGGMGGMPGGMGGMPGGMGGMPGGMGGMPGGMGGQGGMPDMAEMMKQMGGMGGMPGMGGQGGEGGEGGMPDMAEMMKQMGGMGGMGGKPGPGGKPGMPDMAEMMKQMGGMGGMGGMPGAEGAEGKDGKDPSAGMMDMMKNMYENVRKIYLLN